MRRFGSLAAISMCAALIALAACKANDGADTRSRTADAATTSASNTQANSTTTTTTPASAAPTPHVDEAPRITVAELQKALEKGEAVIVDVRNEQSYKAGHIKGARWMFESDVPVRAGELPRDKMIVTYCA